MVNKHTSIDTELAFSRRLFRLIRREKTLVFAITRKPTRIESTNDALVKKAVTVVAHINSNKAGIAITKENCMTVTLKKFYNSCARKWLTLKSMSLSLLRLFEITHVRSAVTRKEISMRVDQLQNCIRCFPSNGDYEASSVGSQGGHVSTNQPTTLCNKRTTSTEALLLL